MLSAQAPVLSKDELLAALKNAARAHGMHCRSIEHEGLRGDLETTSARWLFGGRKVTYHFGCHLDESTRTMRFREAVTEETWGIPAPFFWAEKPGPTPGDRGTVSEHGPEVAGPIEFHRVRHELERFVKDSGWSFAFERGKRVLPRVIRLPDELCGAHQGFVLLTSVIRAHLAELFPGRTVEAFSQFRVTRDSELEVDEDDVTNLRQALRTGLTVRHFGQAVRLEVVRSCPPELYRLLLQQCGLPEGALVRVNGPVNLVRFAQLIDQADAPHLRFEPFEPVWPAARLAPGRSIFAQLRQGDVLLHHPFESFEPVVQFLREAVDDPDVLAIKQTIYRTGTESVLMDLLLEAMRAGKGVMVVLSIRYSTGRELTLKKD